jgi:hypothetical protein
VSRVTNHPRPRIISEVDTGAVNPRCQPGETKVDQVTSAKEDVVYACRDHVSESNADYSEGRRKVEIRSMVWLGGWRTTVSTVAVAGTVPDWVETGRTPLPAPTAAVTSIALDPAFPSGNWYKLSGTVTNSYRASCWMHIEVLNAAGEWKTAASTDRVASGGTATWSDDYWYVPTSGTPTTTVRATASLC